jgi:hypothetical protein
MATVIDWSDVEGTARDMAGNHRRFDSFAWWERPADDENWTVVYVSNRDSTLIDQSNAAEIEKALEPFIEDETVIPQSHSHWAVGYVDGYVIRVFNGDGTITPAFRTWCELQESLSDYPLLNEEDYSEREYEATIENITSAGRRFVKDDAPDEWADEVFSWLWDNHQREIENRDDQGGYPSDEYLKRALLALGWLDIEYMPPQTLSCHICGRIVKDWEEGDSTDIPPHYPHLDVNGHATAADPTATDLCLGTGLEGVVEYDE